MTYYLNRKQQHWTLGHSSRSLPHICFCENQEWSSWCNPIIPTCMRHADGVGGQVDGWGNAETDKERKSRSWEEKKSRLRVRCGMWGYRPVCPAGDYRWLSELNQNCADCQGMGSVTHREPHKRGVTLAQREDTEGEGCNHRVKIAFKWVFEISKNKLPLKKLNRQLICGLDEGQVQSCPPLSFLFISASSIPWHHSFSHIWFPFSHSHS